MTASMFNAYKLIMTESGDWTQAGTPKLRACLIDTGAGNAAGAWSEISGAADMNALNNIANHAVYFPVTGSAIDATLQGTTVTEMNNSTVKFDAADFTFTGIPDSAGAAKTMVVFLDVAGNDTGSVLETSVPVLHFDLTAGTVPNGGDITTSWHANGLFNL